jgi:glucosylceramidase
MKIRLTFLLFLAVSFISLKAQKEVKVYYVNLNETESNSQIAIQEYQYQKPEKARHKINVYPDIEFQTMEGMGGAFNEIGGEALQALPLDAQAEVMKNLFSVEDGAGFSFCRTAVGASDFGIDAYSYDDVEGDYKMKHFSIEREAKTVIPYIQKAYEFNPDLKMFASPWSPPAWMKYSGFMDRGDEFRETNSLKDEAKIYEAYALYFSKYIQAYADKGIQIDRLVVQNETDASTKYPSCLMPVEQMAKFTKNYLRPRFEKDKITSEIWAGTFRTAGQLEGVKLAASADLRAPFDGIGIQYSSSSSIRDILGLYPEAHIMHTEGNCHNGANNWAQATDRFNEIASYVNAGSPNYCYWNMILNETTESGWGWKQNSLINIDRETQKVTYNPDFQTIAFMSKYLKAGTVRVASFSRGKLISVKKDNKLYLLVQNTKDTADSYDCQVDTESRAVVEIPANSLSVIEIDL